MSEAASGPYVECDLPLGRAGLTAHNTLVLAGWACSPNGIAGVAVQIDERQWNAAFGLDSPTAARKRPGLPGIERAGYRLELDTSEWLPGPCYITVAAFDRSGERAAIEGSVEVIPYEAAAETDEERLSTLADGGVALALDDVTPPQPDGIAAGTVEISGWAHGSAGIEAVLVTVDGGPPREALHPLTRPELLRPYGKTVAAEAGFAVRLDTTAATPGPHTIDVIAIARDGRASGLRRTLRLPANHPQIPPPLGRSEPPAPHQAGEDRPVDWRQRATLAEIDAAFCLSEAEIARTEQERTAWRLQRERERAETAVAALEDAHRRIASLEHAAARHAATVAGYRDSLSWRMTRPLRAAKSTFSRPGGDPPG